MGLGWRCRAVWRPACRVMWPVLAAVGALALTGCGPDGQPVVNAAQPRGASVAFESIDGPPAAQFQKLVRDLNEEAQSRRLAVIARDKPSAYRVRGYLAAKVVKRHTTVSWVWDVFDRDNRRALRVTGEETVKDRHRKGWGAADDAMLKRIAGSSMTELAAFLTSPEASPNAQPAPAPRLALLGHPVITPEAAGIFRLFKSDPAASEKEPPAETSAGSVPLPRSRPPLAAAVSARQTVTLAASSASRR
jgi:hypothetical protein